MNDRWSLDELYTSLDSEAFKNDLDGFKAYAKEMQAYANQHFGPEAAECCGSSRADKIEGFIKFLDKLIKYENLFSYSSLLFASDAKNEQAAKTIDVLYELQTELTLPDVMFRKYVGETEELGTVIESSELLKEHRFILNEIKEQAKYMLSDKEEVAISKMKSTGSAAWEKLRDQLAATLMVDIELNGEKRQEPLTVVRNYAYDADPNVRKAAYEAELKSYEKIDTAVAACLNGIKGEVLTTTKMRGHKSPLDMTLIDSRLDMTILNAMFAAIDKYLPVFRRYLKHKAKLLGRESLPFYDLFAPAGSVDMKFTYPEACDYVVKNFASFSQKLGDFARHALDNRWCDVYPREGKQGGAFCASIHSLKQSRILLNFRGCFEDVTTMAHELGHGYHNECLKNESLLNFDHPMPIAETASTFCETLIINSCLKTASSEETRLILDNDLGGAAQVIVDIYSRFLFEDEVFKRRENGGLSVNELKELMLSSQKKAYGEGLDENLLHPYMWVCKSHYYGASHNYYNFPYAYGHLFSKGLFAKYLKDGDSFISEYDSLLASTGKTSLKDAAALAGIDVTTPAFWESSLALIENDIERFISL